MDPIIETLVNTFASEHELDALRVPDRFERFANYCVVAGRGVEESFDVEDVTVDGNEVGIDGLAVQVNGRIVTDPEEVDGLAATNGYLDVRFIFVQAKISESFSAAAVEMMGRAIKDFFGDGELATSEFLKRSLAIKKVIYDRATLFRKGNPAVEAFMVTTGRWHEPLVVRHSMTKLKEELRGTRLFGNIEVEPVDADNLNERWRRANEPPEAVIAFDRRATMESVIGGVESAYVGLLKGTEFLKLIENDDGGLRSSLFEDNVRDFQGLDIQVNKSMGRTIDSADFARFAVLNNGVTVVARKVTSVGDAVTVSDYQIVNGCQTANVIHEHRDRAAEGGFWVPVKIVATDDEDLITEIVMATNSQTAISTEELNSRSRFERRLEKFFEATGAGTDRGLRYERRSRQYAGDSSVPAARVITRRMLVRSYVSMYLEQPHRATGYVTELIRGLGVSLFVDTDKPEPYYASGLAHWKLDNMFQGRIDRSLKPARWYLLMAFRHLALDGEPLAPPSSSQATRQAKKVREALENDPRALALFQKAAVLIQKELAGHLDRDSLRAERPVTLLKAALP